MPTEAGELEKSAVSAPLDNVLEQMDVEAAGKSLLPELRDIVILYYFQGLKMREVADVLQISLSLVKYRLQQAKKQLGQKLGEEGVYEAGRETFDI